MTPATQRPGPTQDAGPRETAAAKGSAPAPAAAATAAVAAKTKETPQPGKVAGGSRYVPGQETWPKSDHPGEGGDPGQSWYPSPNLQGGTGGDPEHPS